MAVKYVKDFSFDRGFGFTGSVQRYAKGGHVTKVPAKAKPAAKGMPARAKPNAPAKGAKRMESPPKVGKGQGYKDGGKVPGKQMDRQPTKTPPGREKDLAPAKPFKGAYEGYAKGGQMRRYRRGGEGEDMRENRMMPEDSSPLDSGLERSPYRPVDEAIGEAQPVYEPSQVRNPPPMREDIDAFLQEYLSKERERFQGEAADHQRWLAQNQAQEQNLTPVQRYTGPVDITGKRLDQPVAPTYDPRRDVESYGTTRPYDAGTVEPLLEQPVSFQRNRMSGDLLHKWDDGTYHYQPQIFPGQTEEGYNPDALPGDYYRNLSREALAAKSEPAMARAVRNVGAGRAVGLGDIMGAARAARPQQDILTPYMPQLRPTTREESDAYMRSIGKAPSPLARFAKGGKVGQAKVGKVMGEYKRGELHSGSKKGPLVKNPKQAVAIALSEARKSGAKIAKKAEGGLSDKELGGKSFAGRNEPLRGRYVSREEKIMREAVAKEKQKDMERKMREAYERTQSQSVSGLKKGGMARKGVPTHKAKAMYGGGKC